MPASPLMDLRTICEMPAQVVWGRYATIVSSVWVISAASRLSEVGNSPAMAHGDCHRSDLDSRPQVVSKWQCA